MFNTPCGFRAVFHFSTQACGDHDFHSEAHGGLSGEGLRGRPGFEQEAERGADEVARSCTGH